MRQKSTVFSAILEIRCISALKLTLFSRYHKKVPRKSCRKGWKRKGWGGCGRGEFVPALRNFGLW